MALEEVGARLITEGEAQFIQSMMRADKAVHGVGQSAQGAQKPAEGLTAKMLIMSQVMGQALYNAAIAAGRAIVGFAKESITAASDLNETISKVGIVFEDQGPAMIKWGESAATALGMSTNEALTAAGTYGNLFRSMGITTDESVNMSKGVVQLAADLASFNNMAPEEVLEKLRAGLTGESEPLKSLGININEVILKEKALEMGLYDGKGALTANAKAQASYALMLEQSTLAQGDFARTSGGLANQQRIMAANVENLKATIGTALLPVVNAVVTAFNNWLNSPGFKAGMDAFIAGISSIVTFIGDIYNDLVGGGIGTAFDSIRESLSTMVPPWVIDLLTGLYQAIEGVVNFFVDNSDTINSTLTLIWGYVEKVFNDIFTFISSIIAVLAPFIKSFLDSLSKWWQENGAQIMATVKVIWDTVYGLFKAALDLILAIVSFALNNIKKFWDAHGQQIMSIIKTLWTVVAGIFTTAISVITSIFKAFTALLKGDTEGFSKYMKEAWDKLWKALKTAAETAWNGLRTWFQGIVKQIGNFFTQTDWASVGRSIIDGIWKGIQAGWAWLKSSVANLAKSLVDAAKGALGIKSPSKLFESIGVNMMIGWQKGILENAGRPMGATAMATQMAIAPAAAVSAGPSTYNYSTTNMFNLGITTSQSPQVVQNSFAMMRLLAG